MSENGKAGPQAPFDKDVDVRTIYWVGAGLAATVLVVYLIVWGLLHVYEGRDKTRGKTNNPLLKVDNERKLQQRVESIPSPPLEGLQPEENKLLLNTGKSEEWFYIPASTYVKLNEEGAQLYDLRDGTEVLLAYWERDKRHVATTITAPPPKDKAEHNEKNLSFATGKIVTIEPLTIRGWREWAAARKGRYGWTDRDKKIAHVPVEQAMQSVLKDKEFQEAGKRKEPLPWLDRATSASSGRGQKEGER